MTLKTRRAVAQRTSDGQKLPTSEDDISDPGRTESQHILAIAKAASKPKAKDDFADMFRERIETDSEELRKLIVERSDDSQQEDVKMKDFVRARVSAVVGTPSTAFRDPNNHSNGQSDSDKKPRFLFDGAESILAASTALLKEYDNIENVLAKGIDKDTEQIRKNGSDDQKEAEALIRTGKAVAMRRVQKAVDGKTSLDINETNAKLAATQFGEDKPVDQTLLHTLGNAERGIGRLMKNLPSE